eukprot:Amastigsp_a682920_4.p4 type:complete len:144 gc:universal Amastigsp_a682920_4:854-423(-)
MGRSEICRPWFASSCAKAKPVFSLYARGSSTAAMTRCSSAFALRSSIRSRRFFSAVCLNATSSWMMCTRLGKSRRRRYMNERSQKMVVATTRRRTAHTAGVPSTRNPTQMVSGKMAGALADTSSVTIQLTTDTRSAVQWRCVQ